MKFLKYGIFGLLFSLSLGCSEEPITVSAPQLLANSPVHFGDSPKGIRQGGRLIITNGGDATLEIADFSVRPEDGVFKCSRAAP